MSIFFLLLCVAAPVALTAIYMVQPRAMWWKISSARFFPVAEAGEEPDDVFRWRRPPFSRAFLFQLAALLLLLLAAVSVLVKSLRALAANHGTRVLVAVDTSASMATRQGGKERWAALPPALRGYLESLDQSKPVALEIHTFDLAVRKRYEVTDARSAWSEIEQTLAGLGPTHLGTNVTALKALAKPGRTLLVLTDQVAPLWARQQTGGCVAWHDLSQELPQPVPNAGFTALTPARDPLTGAIKAVTVEVTGYQMPALPTTVELEMVRPRRQTWPLKLTAGREKEGGAAGSVRVETNEAGFYEFRLRGGVGDACSWDDAASFIVEDRPSVELEVSESANWAKPFRDSAGRGPVGLRIVQVDSWAAIEQQRARAGSVPTLFVCRPANLPKGRLAYFAHRHPLLKQINLDLFDDSPWPTLPERPASVGGFQPVVQVEIAGQWRDIALVRENPPMAVIPEPPNEEILWEKEGVPTKGQEVPIARLLLLINACRFLQEKRPLLPLYKLTEPGHETISLREARLALHPDESNTTAHPEQPLMRALPEMEVSGRGLPLWPWLLVALAIAVSAERCMFVWRGRAWQ